MRMAPTTAPTTNAVLLLSCGATPAGVGLRLGFAVAGSASSLRLRARVTLLPARTDVPQTTQKLAPAISGISHEGQYAVPRAASFSSAPVDAASRAASSTA